MNTVLATKPCLPFDLSGQVALVTSGARHRREAWQAGYSGQQCRRALAPPRGGHRMLCHRYGRIIVVTSASAILGSPADAAYISAKAGLGSLARALAREFAKRLRVF